MEYTNVIKAKEEALRFLRKVSEFEKACKESDSSISMMMMGCKETGAVRRASMDLTRALADMRKP